MVPLPASETNIRSSVGSSRVFMKKLLVIDALSSAYRAFHALPPMTNSSGAPTGAVFGFIRMLLKALEVYRPDGAVIAGDAPFPTRRREKYPQYKANRPPMPSAPRRTPCASPGSRFRASRPTT